MDVFIKNSLKIFNKSMISAKTLSACPFARTFCYSITTSPVAESSKNVERVLLI